MSNSKPTINGREVEIERKYLITPPDEKTMDTLRACEGYDASFIEQMYIRGENGEGGRIRKREFKSDCRYYYTLKQNINGFSKFETEFEISQNDYERLSETKLEDTVPIRKTRHCFLFREQLFELDVYQFRKPFSTLEIELQSEEQSVSLPDFIDIIADVTGDIRYSNYSLAHMHQ